MPHLELSDEEEAVLAVELVQLISRAKYPFSDRVRALGAILNKLGVSSRAQIAAFVAGSCEPDLVKARNPKG